MDARTATEPGTGRRLLALRMHHITQDHTTLDLVLREATAVLAGRGGTLPAPRPYRDFVGRALLSTPAEEHSAYFGGSSATSPNPPPPSAYWKGGETAATSRNTAPSSTHRWRPGCAHRPGAPE
ncbi:hypothetical protein NQP46_31145 [Streptomyces albus]|nr:hypothetical protein NQP46_31145 [Streptomyces albus]